MCLNDLERAYWMGTEIDQLGPSTYLHTNTTHTHTPRGLWLAYPLRCRGY